MAGVTSWTPRQNKHKRVDYGQFGGNVYQFGTIIKTPESDCACFANGADVGVCEMHQRAAKGKFYTTRLPEKRTYRTYNLERR